MRSTTKITITVALCALAAGCVLPPLTGDLKSAREACNRDYPRRIENPSPPFRAEREGARREALGG